MNTMIELNMETRLRIAEMKQHRAEVELEVMTIRCAELIDERNGLIADRERARQQNRELLRQLEAVSGYAPRLLLEAA